MYAELEQISKWTVDNEIEKEVISHQRRRDRIFFYGNGLESKITELPLSPELPTLSEIPLALGCPNNKFLLLRCSVGHIHYIKLH